MGRSSRRERTLADRWHSLAIHLLRRVRRRDPESGVGPAQLSALSVIVFGDEPTLGELAAAEQVRPPTVTRVVQDLEAAGLVALRTDRADRRITRVRATARGRRTLEAGRARRIEELETLLRDLDPRERESLERAADALETRLGGRHARARRPSGTGSSRAPGGTPAAR